MPCQHREESQHRGKGAAEADIAAGKLKVTIFYGDGLQGPSRTDLFRAQYQAKQFELRGVSASLRVTADTYGYYCGSADFEMAYAHQMELEFEKRFGPAFSAEIEARANRRFPI